MNIARKKNGTVNIPYFVVCLRGRAKTTKPGRSSRDQSVVPLRVLRKHTGYNPRSSTRALGLDCEFHALIHYVGLLEPSYMSGFTA